MNAFVIMRRRPTSFEWCPCTTFCGVFLMSPLPAGRNVMERPERLAAGSLANIDEMAAATSSGSHPVDRRWNKLSKFELNKLFSIMDTASPLPVFRMDSIVLWQKTRGFSRRCRAFIPRQTTGSEIEWERNVKFARTLKIFHVNSELDATQWHLFLQD